MLRRADRSGQMLSVLGILAVVALSALMWMAASIIAGTNERADDRRAHLAGDRQFSAAERSTLLVSDGGAAVLAPSAQALRKGDPAGAHAAHGDWADPDESLWSLWHHEPGELCDFATHDACWQTRFGPTERIELRPGIFVAERNVTLRTVSGCSESAFSTIDLEAAQQDSVDLAAGCRSVESSVTRWRRRSFTDYGMHIGSQTASARQGGRPVPFDSTLQASAWPIRTNQPAFFIVCDDPPAFADAEVSEHPGLASGSAVPAADAATAADGTACPTAVAGRFTTAPILDVQRTADDRDHARRCASDRPTALVWMADANAQARSHGHAQDLAGQTPWGGWLNTDAAAQTLDLSAIPQISPQISQYDNYRYTIYREGDLTVSGILAPHVDALSIAVSGDIVLDMSSIDTSTAEVVALIAGCDVVLAGIPAADATLSRVAVLAPHGALYPAAWRTNPGPFPTVTVEGSVATQHWGVFGLYDATQTQQSGYSFDLAYPPGWGNIVPPWWPDPIGSAWQQVSGRPEPLPVTVVTALPTTTTLPPFDTSWHPECRALRAHNQITGPARNTWRSADGLRDYTAELTRLRIAYEAAVTAAGGTPWVEPWHAFRSDCGP